MGLHKYIRYGSGRRYSFSEEILSEAFWKRFGSVLEVFWKFFGSFSKNRAFSSCLCRSLAKATYKFAVEFVTDSLFWKKLKKSVTILGVHGI